MKHSKKVAKLEARQRWYDAQPQSYKNANKKPGSIKLR